MSYKYVFKFEMYHRNSVIKYIFIFHLGTSPNNNIYSRSISPSFTRETDILVKHFKTKYPLRIHELPLTKIKICFVKYRLSICSPGRRYTGFISKISTKKKLEKMTYLKKYI